MATNWRKILQAGALATDALSKGSAGGLGKAIVDSKIDLSGKSSNGDKETNGEYKKNGKQRNVQIQNGDDRLEVNDTNYLQ